MWLLIPPYSLGAVHARLCGQNTEANGTQNSLDELTVWWGEGERDPQSYWLQSQAYGLQPNGAT